MLAAPHTREEKDRTEGKAPKKTSRGAKSQGRGKWRGLLAAALSKFRKEFQFPTTEQEGANFRNKSMCHVGRKKN